MNNGRISWVDVSKGVGIILVTLLHTRISYSGFGYWASSFHMPLFFAVAGLCYDETRYSSVYSYCKRKCVALLYPYVAISLLIGALFWVACFDGGRHFAGLFKTGIINGFSYGNMWFLVCLFFVEVVAACVCRCVRGRGRRIVSALILTIVGYGLCKSSVGLPYLFRQLPLALFCMLFYFAGWSCRPIIGAPCGVLLSAAMFAGSLTASIFMFRLMPQQCILNSMVIGNPVWFFPTAMVGVVALVFFSILLAKWTVLSKPLQWLGRNSLPIFCFHGAVGVCAATWGQGIFVKIAEWALFVALVWMTAGPLHFLVSPDKVIEKRN